MQADGTTQNRLNTYGRKLEPSVYSPQRSLVQTPSLSTAGNTVIRVGREWEDTDSWHQTEHVVLTPAETDGFLDELVRTRCERLAVEAPHTRTGERAPKVAELVEHLTERTLEGLRAAPAITSGASGLLTIHEIIAAKRAVALQLLSGRRGLYVYWVTR